MFSGPNFLHVKKIQPTTFGMYCEKKKGYKGSIITCSLYIDLDFCLLRSITNITLVGQSENIQNIQQPPIICMLTGGWR